MRLADFRGGLALPAAKLPLREAAAELPLQPRYSLSCTDRLGRVAPPRAAAGSALRHGQLIAGDAASTAVSAPTSGVLVEWRQTPAGPLAVFEADGAHRPLPPRAPLPPRPAALAQLWRAGVSGMGGAGFPSAEKLRGAGAPHTLIVNAVECEPLVSSDSQLLIEDAATAVAGARWLCDALPVARAVFAFEPHTQRARAALMAALSALDEPRLSIALVPARYPAGGERQLVEALTGEALARGQRPPARGLLVHNIATVHALGRWVAGGLPLTRRLLSVAGAALTRPQVMWCALGAPLTAVLETAGLRAQSAYQVRIGGPLMGRVVEAPEHAAVAAHHHCLLAEPPPAPPAAAPCVHCGRCADVCPETLLPQRLYAALRAEHTELAGREGLDACLLCGLCERVCPSAIPLNAHLVDGRGALDHWRAQRAIAARAGERSRARNERLARERAEQRRRRSGGARERVIAAALARGRDRARAHDRDSDSD